MPLAAQEGVLDPHKIKRFVCLTRSETPLIFQDNLGRASNHKAKKNPAEAATSNGVNSLHGHSKAQRQRAYPQALNVASALAVAAVEGGQQ